MVVVVMAAVVLVVFVLVVRIMLVAFMQAGRPPSSPCLVPCPRLLLCPFPLVMGSLGLVVMIQLEAS